VAYPNTEVAVLGLIDDATLHPAGNFTCRPINSATGEDADYGIADGSRVGATGTIGAAGTGFVLCYFSGSFLASPGQTEPSCADQVALVGSAHTFAGVAGTSRHVVGVWQWDGLHVTSVTRPRGGGGSSEQSPPCATPAGGWASVAPSPTPNLDLTTFEHYKSGHPGVVVTVASFRPSNLQPVLTIASTDPTATRSALAASYPRALCVVHSHFTLAAVRQARRHVMQAANAQQLPGVTGFGLGEDRTAQPTLDISALSDNPALRKALGSLPPDLLRIHPWLKLLGAANG
jgi:hypothetical protein